MLTTDDLFELAFCVRQIRNKKRREIDAARTPDSIHAAANKLRTYNDLLKKIELLHAHSSPPRVANQRPRRPSW
jgi:hypothetical protein